VTQGTISNDFKPVPHKNPANIEHYNFPCIGIFNIFLYLRRPIPTRLYKSSASAGTPAGSNLKQIIQMPKVKTNSSAKKRFKVTGTGEITYQHSFKRHILTKKSKKRKRSLRKDGIVSSANRDFVMRLLRLK